MDEFHRSANEVVQKFGELVGTVLTPMEIRDLKFAIYDFHVDIYGRDSNGPVGWTTALEAQYAFLRGYGIPSEIYERSVSEGTLNQLFHEKREAMLNRAYHDPVYFSPEHSIKDSDIILKPANQESEPTRDFPRGLLERHAAKLAASEGEYIIHIAA